MTDHSRHFAVACGLALLAALVIPSLDKASAASYQKCYQRWATAYDKNANTAYHNAIAKWSAKASAYLGTPSATWQNASHRKKNRTKVKVEGKPIYKVSVSAKYCKRNPPSSSQNPSAGKKSRFR